MTLKDDVAALTDVVKGLAAKIEEKEKKDEERRSPGTVAKEALPTDDAVSLALEGQSEPVPSEYRAVVDQELNKDFGIHLKYEGGRFKFTVLVPEKYSSLNDEQRKMMGFDMRPRVIDNAEGVNGVTLWCKKVYGNFNAETQARITMDRMANM